MVDRKTVIWVIDDVLKYDAIPQKEQSKFEKTCYDSRTRESVAAKDNFTTHGTIVARLAGLTSNKKTDVKFIGAEVPSGGISLKLVGEAFNYIIEQLDHMDQVTIVNCSFAQKRREDM